MNGFSCNINSCSDVVGQIRNACNVFSCKFTSGIYFLTGEIDIGAWAFTYSLSDIKEDACAHYESIILEGASVNLREIRKQSFYVGQYKSYGEKTFESVIKEALKKSKSDYSYDDMLQKYYKFGFDEDIYDHAKRWRMNCVNQKIWYLSPLIGLALKKKFFLFPWLSKMNYHSGFFLKAFGLLTDENVIVLVPCSEKIQLPTGEKYHTIRMASMFDSFVHHGIDYERDHW